MDFSFSNAKHIFSSPMFLNHQVIEKRNISVFLLLQKNTNSGIVMDPPPPLITILAFERKKMERKGGKVHDTLQSDMIFYLNTPMGENRFILS